MVANYAPLPFLAKYVQDNEHLNEVLYVPRSSTLMSCLLCKLCRKGDFSPCNMLLLEVRITQEMQHWSKFVETCRKGDRTVFLSDNQLMR